MGRKQIYIPHMLVGVSPFADSRVANLSRSNRPLNKTAAGSDAPALPTFLWTGGVESRHAGDVADPMDDSGVIKLSRVPDEWPIAGVAPCPVHPIPVPAG